MITFRLSRIGECLIVDGSDNRICLSVIGKLIVSREQKLKILETVITLQDENKELKERINYAIDGIDAMSECWEESTQKDIAAIRLVLMTKGD